LIGNDNPALPTRDTIQYVACRFIGGIGEKLVFIEIELPQAQCAILERQSRKLAHIGSCDIGFDAARMHADDLNIVPMQQCIGAQGFGQAANAKFRSAIDR